ncbi:MAG: nucleotidyltransferase family protein [Dehalococcoidia bacterium]
MILAASEGGRVHPLTRNIPKPMLDLCGRPLIAHQIDLLRLHGVREIGVNLHHRPQVIRSYLGDGSRFGVRIVYSREDVLLGSAGAVKKLEEFFDDTFYVLYGDVLTDIDLSALAAFHWRRGADLTLALYRTDEPERCGIAEVDDGAVRRFQEKPAPEQVFSRWANAGVYVVEPSVLGLIPEDSFFDFGTDVIPLLLQEKAVVGGYIHPAYFLDIGSPERYQQAQRDLALGKLRNAVRPASIQPDPSSQLVGDREDVASSSAREDQFRRRWHRPARVLRVVRRDGG